MQVNGLYNLNIYIGDQKLFPETNDDKNVLPGGFIGAEIFESITNPVPSCVLECVFVPAVINSGILKDGTPIRFEISSEYFQLKETLYFRLYKIRELRVQTPSVFVSIEGVLDFYKGYTDGNAYNVFGPSSQVFDDIAKNNGLGKEIDTTADEQLWVAGQNNVYKFMNFVAKHGYINDGSGMIWCMDRHKTLIYKDIKALFNGRSNSIYTFLPTPKVRTKNQFEYSGATASLPFGPNNIKNDGYGVHNYSFDFENYEVKDIEAKGVCCENTCICINEELSKGLNYVWDSFDFGNYHKNYIKAEIQNRRVLSTYSTHVNLKCQYHQPFRLCQIVNLIYGNARSKEVDKSFGLPSLSTVYMIDSIKIFVSWKNISASVGLVTQGMNVDKGDNYGPKQKTEQKEG